MTVIDFDFRCEIADTLRKAGKTDRASVRAAMLAMVAKLQESYPGRLAAMVPSDVPFTTQDQWERTFIFAVMEPCHLHRRTPELVRAALASVL